MRLTLRCARARPRFAGSCCVQREPMMHEEVTTLTKEKLNLAGWCAVTSGVKELREVLAGARDRLSVDGQRTLLFIDEIQ